MSKRNGGSTVTPPPSRIEKADVELPKNILETVGSPIRRDRTEHIAIDDPILVEFQGARAPKTLQRMLLDSVISGIVDRMALLLRAPEWTVEAGITKGNDEATDADMEFAEFVNENFARLTPGWNSTVADSAEMVVWGFYVAEILFEQVDSDIMWSAFLPISQETVQGWRTDPKNGMLTAVKQTDFASGQKEVWIPAPKVIHFVTKPAAGRPEGKSLARNAFLSWSDKQEVRRIMKSALRRDWTGIADLQVPPSLLSAGANESEKALLTSAEEMVREVERDEREGIVRPSETDENGNPTGWKFQMLTSNGNIGRQGGFREYWELHNKDIAIALLSEVVLLGLTGTGSFALAREKTAWLARAIGAFLDLIGEHMEQKAFPTLQRLNPRFANAAIPTLKHGDVEQLDLESISTYFSSLAGSGLVMPDPELEKYLRRQAGAPNTVGEEEL